MSSRMRRLRKAPFRLEGKVAAESMTERCNVCDEVKKVQTRVSGILCVRHNMAERSMYAKQEDDESGLGRGGANAVDPQRTH